MNISYRLIKIEIKQFALFPEAFNSEEKITVDAELDFAPTADRMDIRSIMTLRYKQQERLLVVLELACFFNISPESWDAMKKDGHWIVPVDFLRYMGTIIVGAARGVLHAKTESTVLNAYILPPINVMELVDEDFIIE